MDPLLVLLLIIMIAFVIWQGSEFVAKFIKMICCLIIIAAIAVAIWLGLPY